MNIHAPPDEVGRRRMRAQADQVLARDHPRVADVVEALGSFPEMRRAATTVQLLHILGHLVEISRANQISVPRPSRICTDEEVQCQGAFQYPPAAGDRK